MCVQRILTCLNGILLCVLSHIYVTLSLSSFRRVVRYYGETYISSLEQHGWDTVAFKPNNPFTWTNAHTVTYAPIPRMVSQLQPPIRAVHSMPAVSVQRVLREDYTKYVHMECEYIEVGWGSP